MRVRAMGTAAGLFTILLSVLLAAPAGAQTPAPEISTKGSNVAGELARGQTVTVNLRIAHPDSWERIQGIEVELQLRGSALEQIALDPTTLSVTVAGDGPSASFGETGRLRGSFLELNPARLGVSAKGRRLSITMPLQVREDPPPGARLFFSVSASGVVDAGFRALTPPVEEQGGGFSWGTLGVAVAGALFLGGFVGNLFSSRRRPQGGPSVYASVQRRLEEERSKK